MTDLPVAGSDSRPLEVGRANQSDVRIRWADGHESVYRAADLRLACPCASCASERSSAPVDGRPRLRVVPSGVEQVRPLGVELCGSFGIRIHWSDGHSQGIYAFTRLRAACPCCGGSAAGTTPAARPRVQ